MMVVTHTLCPSSVHELFVTSLAEPRPVQRSGHTVATTAPVSVDSSNTIPPGIAYFHSQNNNISEFLYNCRPNQIFFT